MEQGQGESPASPAGQCVKSRLSLQPPKGGAGGCSWQPHTAEQEAAPGEAGIGSGGETQCQHFGKLARLESSNCKVWDLTRECLPKAVWFFKSIPVFFLKCYSIERKTKELAMAKRR